MSCTGTLRLKSDRWDGEIESLAADIDLPTFHHCHSLCHSQSWLPFFILLQQKADSYLSAVVDVKGLYLASTESGQLFVSLVDVKGFYLASTESGQLFVSCGGCERSLSCFSRKWTVICQLWQM